MGARVRTGFEDREGRWTLAGVRHDVGVEFDGVHVAPTVCRSHVFPDPVDEPRFLHTHGVGAASFRGEQNPERTTTWSFRVATRAIGEGTVFRHLRREDESRR